MADSPAAVRRRVQTKAIPPVPVTDQGGENDPAFDTGDKDIHKPVSTNGVSGERLRSFIERIERLNADIEGLRADVKEVKSEAKGSGFDLKIINHLIRIRRMDKDDLDEQEALLDIYKRALGMS